jgi:hypothetical protein
MEMVALGTKPHSYAKIAAKIPSGPDYTYIKGGCMQFSPVWESAERKGSK